MRNARESLEYGVPKGAKVEISELRIFVDYKLVCNEHAAKNRKLDRVINTAKTQRAVPIFGEPYGYIDNASDRFAMKRDFQPLFLQMHLVRYIL